MNAYQLYRITKENYFNNFYPRFSTDETTPVTQGLTEGARYHYDRRDDIVDALVNYIPSKAQTKFVLTAGMTYARRRPAHLAARFLTRSIPFIGWGLLAYDVYQLYHWYDDYAPPN